MALLGADYDKYIIQTIDMGVGFDISTHECLFMLDQIKDATLSNSLETSFATGKGGARLSGLDRNKAAKISGNNGYIVGGLLASQIGEAADVSSTETILTPHFEIMIQLNTLHILLARKKSRSLLQDWWRGIMLSYFMSTNPQERNSQIRVINVCGRNS